MAEYVFVVMPNRFVLKPSVLYMHSDPHGNTADINLNSLLFQMAVGYHSSFSLLLAYEFSVGSVANFDHGTYEVMFTYAFGRNSSRNTRIRVPWNWTY